MRVPIFPQPHQNNVLSNLHRCLHIKEVNDSNATKDKKEELGIFCYYKVLYLFSGTVLFENDLD